MNPAIGHSGKHLYEFGAFCLDPAERILLHAGKRVPLVPKAIETLLILIQHSGHLLTKDELIKSVWPDTFVEENNLNQHISALRRALRDGQDGDEYIETVPRLGYRFVKQVRVLPEEESALLLTRRTSTHFVIREEEEEEQEEEQQPADSLSEQTRTAERHRVRQWLPRLMLRRKWIAWLATMILAAGITSAALTFWHARTRNSLVAQPSDILVVLPFRNLRPDPDSNFLGVALADVAGGQLSYTSQVVVHPSTSVHNYGGSDQNLDPVPKEAHKQMLVTGNYLKEVQGVRLSVELVAEPGHVTLWHGSLGAGMDGLITLQDLMADQIGAALHVQVRHIVPQPLTSTKIQPNPAAYEYFLRGVDAWERHDLRGAIQWHEKAVSANPDFGPAFAYLAFDYVSYCYRQSAYPNPVRPEPGYIERSLALYQQAVDRNAASPAILSMGGLYLMELGRLDESVALLRRALQLNPNYAQGHLWLGQAYRYGGMLKESRSEAELALRLDPDIREYSTVNTYLYLGEYEKFLEYLPRTQLSARVLFYRGLAHYYKGDLRHAESQFRRAYELESAHPHAQYAQAFLHALAGKNDEGIRLLRDFERGYQADGEMLYKVAQAYAMLGDKHSSLRLLRQSLEHNFYCYPYFTHDLLLESLRAEPEYSELMDLARQRHETFRHRFF